MKKTTLINSEISYLISSLGHTDTICLADAGLPVPNNVSKIDVAIKLGLPSFLETLSTIASEAKFEEVIFAKEILNYFPKLINNVKIILKNNIKISMIPHELFKEKTKECKAIIRTGENKWFHNVILKSGVVF